MGWRASAFRIALRIAALSSMTVLLPLSLDWFLIPWRTVLVLPDISCKPIRVSGFEGCELRGHAARRLLDDGLDTVTPVTAALERM